MAQKPSIPKGTRDFSPAEMVGRDYIFTTVKDVFKKFGYQPIETPSLENLNTLLGKYGDEGDKLLFKVLNSGDAFSGIDFSSYNVETEEGTKINSNALSLKVCEKGLRYDLTVPFARFVVQHQNEISFPFKRYQIQPVWRADRPQKGRYREFYQCDVDVIGSKSLLNELELVQIVEMVFGLLNIKVCIKINNRKILSGLAEVSGHPDKLIDITVAIDKIDKIGLEEVEAELREKGIDDKAIAVIEPVLTLQGTNNEKIAKIGEILAASETGMKGVDEIKTLFGMIDSVGISQEVEFDLSLARGLNYYTGAIFEVKAKEFEIGSICGGGRYDDLTGIFGLENMSGVGISFGADRIYDVMKGLNLFPDNVSQSAMILFTNMGERELLYTIPVAGQLRQAGIKCEIYPDNTKLKKQFEYADKKGIPYLGIVGENEINEGGVMVKSLTSGEQNLVKIDEITSYLSSLS
ncbi:MAG: histidine--tRNA ligase [Bacteroidales bacterium]|nr:histidine--tRNA ligase [Bacteroidales bacterium]MDD4670295.1 histidine--tRNA ligase [Bacteroidales bacterium]